MRRIAQGQAFHVAAQQKQRLMHETKVEFCMSGMGKAAGFFTPGQWSFDRLCFLDQHLKKHKGRETWTTSKKPRKR
jgi:hypothetical protein